MCVCVYVCELTPCHARATPTGVVPPAKGKNVKRLSSIIEQRTEAMPTPPPAPPRTLHPAVKKEIAAFKAQWLNQVTTSVHSTLPTVEGVWV